MRKLLTLLLIIFSITTFAQEGKDPIIPVIPKAGEQPLDKPVEEDQSKRPKESNITAPSIINANAVATGNPVGQSPAASPEVAFNNRIKDIPVNLFTGTPIINFPIYTLSEPGGVSVPIYLNYNASGAKGADVASWVGLNFTFNAGGMISRIVRGIPDEGKFEIDDLNARTFHGRKGFYYYGVATTDKESDTQPDLFYLSVGGANYKFSFDASHKAHFYPDADIDVKVIWNSLGQGVGEFSSWEITMPDGTRYFFNKNYSEATFELEAQEALLSYPVGYSKFNDYQKAEQITSGWYLVQIKTAFGHETNFEYTKNQYSFFKLAEQEMQTNNCDFTNVSKKINKVYASSSTLKRISNFNIEVEFNKDEIVCYGDICGTTSNYPNRFDIDAWTNYPANSSNAKILRKITVHDKNSPNTSPKMEWTLDYNYLNINDQEPSPPFGYTYTQIGQTHRRRLILRQLNLPDGTNYQFRYYQDQLGGVPTRFASTDHWGFINDRYNANLLIGKDYFRNCANGSLPNREASTLWSKFGTMSSFHHSMGSNTYFEYENHTAENYKNGSSYILIGGNRVTKITQTDSVSNITTVKNYSYDNGSGGSSGFLCLKPVYRFDSKATDQQNEYWNSALYSMLLSESGRPAVGYTRIKETLASGAVGALATDNIGSTVSYFDREFSEINVRQTTISNCTPYPNPVCDTTRFTRPWLWNPFHSFKDGTPTQVLVFNKNGGLISSKSMEYDESYYSSNLNGYYYPYQASKRPFRMNGKNYNFENSYYEFYYKHRLKQEHISTNNLDGTGEVRTDITHFYKDEMPLTYRTVYPGKHNQLVKTVTTNSNGHQLESFTKYAADFDFGKDSTYVCYQIDPQTNDCLSWGYEYTNHVPTNTEAKGVYQLKERHIINGFVEGISKQNGNITSASYQTYHPENTSDAKAGLSKSNYIIENIPRATMTEANFNVSNGNWSKDADYDLKSTADQYNLWGLPIKTTEKFGTSSKIDYDITNTLPIKTYKNLGKPDEQTTQTEYNTKIFGISKEISPNALEIRKEFYPDGKLKQILDKDGKVLKHITYLYRGTADASLGTDQNKNRVIIRIPRIATTDATTLTHLNCNISIQYTDGAGRSMQNIEYRASPAGKDLISGTAEYDKFGRPFKTFLPIESEFDDGRFVDTTTVLTRAKAFYGTDEAVFSEVVYENSPLSRPLKGFGPGKAWRDLGIFTEMDYQTVNTATGVKKMFALVGQNKVFVDNYTNDGQLLKKITKDERGSSVIEYSDKMGNVVRRDVQSTDSEYLTTAYVYDDANRLRYVLPPNAYEAVKNLTELSESGDIFNEMIYAHHYDGRGRVYESHTPGTGWSRVVYNRLNQPVLTQDDDEASSNIWNYAQTDGQGRTVRTGQIQPSNWDRSYLQGLFNNYTVDNQFEERSTGAGHIAQYTNRSFPTQLQNFITEQSLKTVAYFDNYSWRSGISGSTGTASDYDFQTNPLNISQLAYSRETSAIGLATGSLIKDDLYGDLLFPAVNYYDDKNRSIQSIAYNHLQARDQTDTKYNFNGEVTKSSATYRQSGHADIVRTNTHIYDHVGRPKSLAYGVSLYNGGAEFPMNSFDYDLVGRMKTKYIQPSAAQIGSTQQTGLWGNGSTWQGGSPSNLQTLAVINTGHTVNIPENANYEAASLMNNGTLAMGTGSVLTLGSMQTVSRIALQAIDYTYNIRSQLRGVNLDASGNLQTSPEKLFSYKLDYHEDGRYYDGNISKQSWKSHNSPDLRTYTYTYDRSNRIKDASFTGKGNEAYGVSNITYDLMSNIQTMNRNGLVSTNNWGEIDKLNYTYKAGGNKLDKVDDIGQYASAGGFKDGNGGTDYGYTSAGKITVDFNKGINSIEYNYLDLVKKQTFTDGRIVEYGYSTTGQRRMRKVTKNGTINYTFYNGEIVYTSTDGNVQNATIAEIQNSEGRFVDGKFTYGYTDQVGNLRLSYRDSVLATGGLTSIVIQENAYDPFGVPLDGLNFYRNGLKDNYLISGREIDSESENALLDWRDYDPTTGRMKNPDPMGDIEEQISLSPYQYSWNNPVMLNDPDGKCPTCVVYGVAALVGGVVNVASNWSKIKANPLQGLGYFAIGAVGGAVSVNNIFTGSAVTSGLNATFDIATGNVPDIQNATDVFKYVGTEAVKGLAAAKIGSTAGKYIGPAISKLGDRVNQWFKWAYEGIDEGFTQLTINGQTLSFAHSYGIKGSLVPIEKVIGSTIAVKAVTSLVKTGTQFSKHSLERLAQRGVTQDMAELAISNGQKFYDPLNKSINYVLPNSFASGKSLLVGTNPLTGQVTTVLRSSKNLINRRFIPIK